MIIKGKTWCKATSYFRIPPIQGRLRIPKAGGQGFLLRVHLCICMFLHKGRFWSSNSFPEEKCWLYWPLSKTITIRGSGGLIPEKIFEPNCLQRRKMPLPKIGEIERVHYEGQFLPLLPSPVTIADFFSIFDFVHFSTLFGGLAFSICLFARGPPVYKLQYNTNRSDGPVVERLPLNR